MIKNPLLQASIDRSVAISELIKRWIKKDRQATVNESAIQVLPEHKPKILPDVQKLANSNGQ